MTGADDGIDGRIGDRGVRPTPPFPVLEPIGGRVGRTRDGEYCLPLGEGGLARIGGNMNPLDDEDPEGCSDSLLVMMYASSPGRRRGRGRGLSSGEAEI